jgi:hypothetical protein
MGFWNGVTPDSVANASDGFKEFIIGDNDAYIKKVEEDVSQSGNDMLVVTFANDDGAEIKHFIVDGEYKQQKLKQLYIAFNIPFASQNIQSWIGKRGIVVCKQGKPNSNGNVYNQVSYLKPKPGPNVNPRPTHTQPSRPANQHSQQPYNPPADQAQNNDGFDDDIPF